MRASAAPLTILEIAVRRCSAAFAGVEPVGVHPDAHRAAGFAPVETRGAQRIGDALFLGLSFDQPRSRHHPPADVRRHMAAAYASSEESRGGKERVSTGGLW